MVEHPVGINGGSYKWGRHAQINQTLCHPTLKEKVYMGKPITLSFIKHRDRVEVLKDQCQPYNGMI